MANRILLGQKGSEYGLWVSKPTKDVTSVSSEDMIFSTSLSNRYGQLLSKGEHTFSSTSGDTLTVDVTMKDGTPPAIWWTARSTSAVFFPSRGEQYIEVTYSFPSTNTCRVVWTKYTKTTPTIVYFISNLED